MENKDNKTGAGLNYDRPTFIVAVIGVFVAIVAIVVDIAHPESRRFFELETLEPKDIKSKISAYFQVSQMYGYIDEDQECELLDGCDCCGGRIAFDESGLVYFMDICVGSGYTYRIGNYELTEEGILCTMRRKQLDVSQDGIITSGQYGADIVTLTKTSCADTRIIYRLNHSEWEHSVVYKIPYTYIEFVQYLKNNELYDRLHSL